MKYLLNIIYFFALLLYSPVLIYRMVLQNRYRTGWKNRLGKINRRHPEKKCIWIHAVSVGEVNATRTLVEQLSKRLNEYEIVISTTTDTGMARAKALYGAEHSVFIFPFDFSFIIKRAFENLKPELCLLMELEVWPNFVSAAKKNNTALIVANGRISDKSFPSYKKVKWLIKPIFKKLDMVLAQTKLYAERFILLGCDKDRVTVSSSLKYDTADVTESVPGADKISKKLKLNSKTLIVAGGTGPGEEKMLIEVFSRLLADGMDETLTLAIAPRKPERFEDVAELAKQADENFIRYSDYKDNNKSRHCEKNYRIILVDTMGDLRKFYSLAKLVFVGRSLVPMGGSDMIEAAALGKTTFFGPYTENFKQSVNALLNGHGAIEVKDSKKLYKAFKRCLLDPEYAGEFARHGRKVVIDNKGATEKTVNAVENILTHR